MKIALKSDSEKIYVAYGIYWATARNQYQRCHCVIEVCDNLAGFSVLCADEVNICVSSLDHYLITQDDQGRDLLIHKAAFPDREFFDALVNHDDFNNVELLFQSMRELGLEP